MKRKHNRWRTLGCLGKEMSSHFHPARHQSAASLSCSSCKTNQVARSLASCGFGHRNASSFLPVIRVVSVGCVDIIYIYVCVIKKILYAKWAHHNYPHPQVISTVLTNLPICKCPKSTLRLTFPSKAISDPPVWHMDSLLLPP